MKSNEDVADIILKYITENGLYEFVHIYFDNKCYYWEEEAQEHSLIYNIKSPIQGVRDFCLTIDLEVTYRLSDDLLKKKIERLEDGFKCLGLEYEKHDMLTFCII